MIADFFRLNRIISQIGWRVSLDRHFILFKFIIFCIYVHFGWIRFNPYPHRPICIRLILYHDLSKLWQLELLYLLLFVILIDGCLLEELALPNCHVLIGLCAGWILVHLGGLALLFLIKQVLLLLLQFLLFKLLLLLLLLFLELLALFLLIFQ